ncbi:amidohydrolase family protein [Gordonia sp. NPDC127522]|uniref:amidohydrolase family protein n=1 Tax=Gordonia sp. NPDC127522 TaxID=3345390 RepID=UPI003625CEE7
MTPSQSPPMGRVDIHSHFMPSRSQRGDSDLPRLVVDPGEGRIMIGERIFRTVQPALWDVEKRLTSLDEAGISHQVISPVPVTLAGSASEADTTRYLQAQNDGLLDAAARSGGRLLVFGAVPMFTIAGAVRELDRLAGFPGVVGVEMSSLPGGRELDDPELWPFYAAAEEHDLALFVHPTQQQSAVRGREKPYPFAIGMHTDTALAASAVVLGGVLERFANLRLAFAHGCGSLPWTYPRLRTAACADDPAQSERLDALLARLWCDTLVFEPRLLELLAARFGPDHLLIGSDYPFYRTPLAELVAIGDKAGEAGAIDDDTVDAMSLQNAAAFFGRRSPLGPPNS